MKPKNTLLAVSFCVGLSHFLSVDKNIGYFISAI